MLRPDEIAIGSFREAEGLTLMLPRSKSDETILISAASGVKLAIYLGQYKYDAYPCGDSDKWKGVLVPGVTIELDESSVFDPDREDAPLGSVVRGGTGLDIMTKAVDNFQIDRKQPVGLLSGLPVSRERCSAGYTRWQIVLGEGDETRVLLEIDARPPRSTVDTDL